MRLHGANPDYFDLKTNAEKTKKYRIIELIYISCLLKNLTLRGYADLFDQKLLY